VILQSEGKTLESFKNWLNDELDSAKSGLQDIPSQNRKGLEVGMLRKRAREAEVALSLVCEFESKEALNCEFANNGDRL
jgi:hypothetical protein